MNLCVYLPVCAGCHFDQLPYDQQSDFKIKSLETSLATAGLTHPKIQFLSCGENGLRHRFDFTIEADRMGLYGKDKTLQDIKSCLQISPELQQAYTDFRKIQFPIRKGSVRLRIGPDGKTRGAWLDFANVDIKNLLDDGSCLQTLFDLGFYVEVGQKNKSVALVNQKFKLVDPILRQWFKTELKNYVSQKLSCYISSFTQPSWITAKAMVKVVFNWLSELETSSTPLSICEFGAGIGQFTLPLLSSRAFVDVYEFDESATQALRFNAKAADLDANLEVHVGDFQKKDVSLQKRYDLAFVNPPRSGLKNFVHEIIRLKTKNCIYISCFPESLITDLKALTEAGYKIQEMTLVDQFPQTKHFETCVLLQRIDA